MRATLGLWIVLALCPAAPAPAHGLYETSVIVTGMGRAERQGGLRRALGAVLVKVSGNAAWATDPRLGATETAPLLEAIVYRDRESNLPKHDEQGTRDRPYDLVARFAPDRVDALLRKWGDAPWPEPRPLIEVDVVVTPRNGTAVGMRADTDPDERHRGALLDAADKAGLGVVLPLADGSQAATGGPVLRGVVRWSDADYGWVATWTLGADSWGIRGVGFDAAYRTGMEGAASVLSRHGAFSGEEKRP